MASFQPKTGWKRSRKRENKNYHYVSFLPRRVIENSNKIAKKFKEIKIYHYAFISSQNRLDKVKKERKYKLSFRFVPTRRIIENSKKIAKKFKKLKYTIMALFQAKIGWKMLRKREYKNYRSISFLPDA